MKSDKITSYRYTCLLKTLKNVNKQAWKNLNGIIHNEDKPLKIVENNNTLTITLSSDTILNKAYGPFTIKFEGNQINMNKIIEIEPYNYLVDCYKAPPISYKGVAIPDTKKDKFKIDMVTLLK